MITKFILQAYLVNGERLILDKNSWTDIEVLDSITPIFWDTSLNQGYSEITSLSEIYEYGFNRNKDFKFVRDQLKLRVNSLENGFEDLSQQEKLELSTLNIGNLQQRTLALGKTNLINSGIFYHSKSVESRSLRAGFAVSYIFNIYTKEQASEILSAVLNANNLFINYTQFGIEGTLEEGPFEAGIPPLEGIADYLYGRPGTSFQGIGLIDKTFSTNQQVLDLYNIFINGIY